jgi:aminoglycoside phosphotransferase (APT) family kinase protein
MKMNSDLPEAELSDWLRINLPDDVEVRAIRVLSGGQSNPTYRVTTARRDLVLRRKPFGELLASAHAVDREYRLISALHPVGYPVPEPVALCQERDVIGAEFYLMEALDARVHFDGMLPDYQPAERRAIYEAAIATLATLHAIDPDTVGLQSYGRPGNYFARQVDRWTKQYRAAQTEEIEEVEKLIDWLPRTVPEQKRTSIVHGDFRIDNMLFAKRSASVMAVIDWELSTIGDPLADLSYFAMAWMMPSDWHASGIHDADFASLGIPPLDEVVEIYCEISRWKELPDLRWYFAYNMFRLIGIAQGIKRRMLDGNASSDNALDATSHLKLLAKKAWVQARLAGLR